MAEDRPPVESSEPDKASVKSGAASEPPVADAPAGSAVVAAAPVAEPAASGSPEGSAAVADAPVEATASAGGSSSGGGDASLGPDGIDQAVIDEILKQASFEDASQAIRAEAKSEGGASGGGAEAAGEVMKLPSFQQVMQEAQVNSIDLLRDVDLNVKIELGRARMLVEDVLKLSEGSVVELDKLAGDPVDVFVNERLVARGEVLVLNDNFCVRINEIMAGVKEEGL